MGPDLHRPQTLTPAFGGNRFLLPQDLDEDPLWWEPFHGPSQQLCWLLTPVCSPFPSNSASLHCPSILLFLFHSHFSTTYLFLLVLLAQGLWVSGMVLLRAMSHPYIMALSKGHLGMVCSTRPVLPWTGGHLRLGPCPGPMVPDWWSFGLAPCPWPVWGLPWGVICLEFTPAQGPKTQVEFSSLQLVPWPGILSGSVQYQMAGCLRLAPCLGILVPGWTGGHLRLGFVREC